MCAFRTTSIRWKFVVNCMVELIVSSAVLAYLYKSLLLQPLEQYGGVTYAWRDLLVIFFRFTMAAPLFTLLLFGFVLDSWQNLFAEFTMFADRLFYKVNILDVPICNFTVLIDENKVTDEKGFKSVINK